LYQIVDWRQFQTEFDESLPFEAGDEIWTATSKGSPGAEKEVPT
jgi:hypothetical protein